MEAVIPPTTPAQAALAQPGSPVLQLSFSWEITSPHKASGNTSLLQAETPCLSLPQTLSQAPGPFSDLQSPQDMYGELPCLLPIYKPQIRGVLFC
jgi:hypothetical protein